MEQELQKELYRTQEAVDYRTRFGSTEWDMWIHSV